MPGFSARACAATAAAALLILVTAADATATTFCVPNFHSACPSSGGNVAEADLEKAMSLQSEDGNADRVVIAAGTFTEDSDFEPPSGDDRTFEPYGPDPLTIVGAGPEATILTTGATGNIFLFNFSSSYSRPATMRDLTLRIPATFTDNQGGALQLYECVLENIDIVSLNPGSDGVGSAIGPGNVFRDGELRGEGGGSIDAGFRTTFDGVLLVEDTTIRDASWALNANGKGSELTARRVRSLDGGAYGVAATEGTANVENSTFTLDDGIGLYASAKDDDAALDADHITIVNANGSNTAVEAKKFGGGAGDVTVVASNSIFRGFGSGYRAETTIGPGIGLVSLEVSYSNIRENGSNTNGSVDLSTGNIDADPLLAEDLSLPAGSPSIDTGDPAAGGLPTDFLGKARPVDGTGDGVARRDQGAFEYRPPMPINPSPSADGTPPQTRIARGPGKKLAKGIAKFRFKSNEPGSTFRCKLDRRKAAKCKSPRTYRRLRPGRHTFKVWAIDAAGNKDPTPAKRRFGVPKD
jgi:hypothetical protein